MLTFKMAIRNIFRQKRRTFLTILTMFGGFTLAAITIGWSDGSYSYVIDMFTRNRLGHIQIHGAGYLDKPTLYNTIKNYENLGAKFEETEGVFAWTPRLYSAGLASVDEKSAGVRIIGINPAREIAATRFDKKVVAGKGFSPTPSGEVILGKGLSKILKTGIGDEIVIVSQGADGSIANDLYEIIGFCESGDELSDQANLYLHLQDAQELLVLYNQVHEIAIIADELSNVAALTAEITDLVNDSTVSVASWQEFARSFYTAMKADQQGGWVMIFVIIFVVAVGVLNTVLMTVLERTREYGVLRAIGTRPIQVFRLVLYEVTVMVIISIIIGFILSITINYLLSQHGIAMPQPFTYGGIEFSRMYTEISARSFIIPAITVALSALLISIFPAVKAARVEPARSMRTH